MLIVLIQNISLLVSSIVVYTMIIRRWEKGSVFYSLMSGVLFGVVSVMGMMMPYVLEQGIIFDGRTIVLSLAGLFGGSFSALPAALIAALYRLSVGGNGATVGVLTIIQSSFFGVIFHELLKRGKLVLSAKTLILLSVTVHLVMLCFFLFIPGLSMEDVIMQLALPVIVIYPLAFLIMAYLIIDQEQRISAQKLLKESEMRLSKTQRIAKLGSWEVDLQTNKLTWSDEVYRIMGVVQDGAPLTYMSFLEVVHPDDREMVNKAYIDSLAEKKDSYEVEHRIIRQDDGEIRFVQERCEHITDGSGMVVRSVGMIQDITERKHYESKLKHLSEHDQLTGLCNRNYFEDELHRARTQESYPLTIITADLDGLKLVNDTLGHRKGDELLMACAAVLKDSLRQTDVVARIGGDEFAVIMEKANVRVGEQACARIRKAVDAYNQKQADSSLSLSLGMATAEDAEDDNLGELLKKADDMMYRDKLTRRNNRQNSQKKMLS